MNGSLKDVKWCTNCVSMSTRPRISFDERGWCNACQWTEKKKSLDWKSRQEELLKLLDRHRRNDGNFDCLVPVSGGKDGSYVAFNLKYKYGMNPLAVTVTPPLALKLGEANLRAFVDAGYDHLSINPSRDAMRKLDSAGLSEMGSPYFGWLVAVHTVPPIIATKFDISLIFYGEDGEVEYGGTTETAYNPIYGFDYQKKVYLEGGHEKMLANAEVSDEESFFFRHPDSSSLDTPPVEMTHWSYFESWDPYRNYLVAKENCGLKEAEKSNPGTFTNFSQNDQALYGLHTYIMYLKFGFGRCNQDACIEVRRGAMDRQQAVNLVRLYDGQFPTEHLQDYCEYYRMTESDLYNVLAKWTNKDLFSYEDGQWKPLFEIA